MAKNSKIPTGSRAEIAKQRAAALREAQNASKKRSQIIIVSIIAAVVLVLAAVIVFVVLQNPSSDSNIQKAILNSKNVPSEFNDDGSFTVSSKGGGKSAEIPNATVVDIYNDFICPSCGALHRSYKDVLEKLKDSGKVVFHMHPLSWFDSTSPLGTKENRQGNDRYSTRAGSAAVYVAQNAPDKYFDFVETMYKQGNQPCEGFKDTDHTRCSMPAGGYDPADGSDQKIQEHIVEAGISQDIASKATSGDYEDYIANVSNAVSKKRLVTGTPAIFINGEKWNWLNDQETQMKEPDEFYNSVVATFK